MRGHGFITMDNRCRAISVRAGRTHDRVGPMSYQATDWLWRVGHGGPGIAPKTPPERIQRTDRPSTMLAGRACLNKTPAGRA